MYLLIVYLSYFYFASLKINLNRKNIDFEWTPNNVSLELSFSFFSSGDNGNGNGNGGNTSKANNPKNTGNTTSGQTSVTGKAFIEVNNKLNKDAEKRERFLLLFCSCMLQTII